jgi:hypothetical protein
MLSTGLLFFAIEWLIIFPGSSTGLKNLSPLHSLLDWFSGFPARIDATRYFLHYQPETSTAHQFVIIKIWIIVMLVQALLSGAVSYSALWYLRETWRQGLSEGRVERICKVVVRVLPFALALYLLLPIQRVFLGRFEGCLRVLWSGGAPIFSAGVATIAMWSMEGQIKSITGCCSHRDFIRFTWLKQGIQTMLSMSSAILVLGLVGLSSRRVVLLLFPNNVFEKQEVLLQALEYTIMIGLAYIPAHSAVNRAAVRIRDAIVPKMEDSRAPVILDYWKTMTALDEILQIRLHDWKSLGPGFAILAPVLLGLIATVAGRHL